MVFEGTQGGKDIVTDGTLTRSIINTQLKKQQTKQKNITQNGLYNMFSSSYKQSIHYEINDTCLK